MTIVQVASLLHAQLEYGVASVLGRHGRTLVCTPSGATATWQDTPSYYPPGSCAGALLPLLCLFFVWYVCCAALCLCHGGDLWGMGVLLPWAANIGSSHRVQIADCKDCRTESSRLQSRPSLTELLRVLLLLLMYTLYTERRTRRAEAGGG